MVINQQRLCYFHAVSTYGQIRAASDHLNTHSSVIARQIKLLEEEIGYKLFERRPRGVSLTEAGELLLKYYHVNYSLQADLDAGLQDLINLRRGTIQIATSPIFIDVLMDHVIKDFSCQYPQLQINVQEVKASSQIITKILEDEAHIGMMTHHPQIIQIFVVMRKCLYPYIY